MNIPSRREETKHTLTILRNTMAGSGDEYVLVSIEAPWGTLAIEVDLAPVIEALDLDERSGDDA